MNERKTSRRLGESLLPGLSLIALTVIYSASSAAGLWSGVFPTVSFVALGAGVLLLLQALARRSESTGDRESRSTRSLTQVTIENLVPLTIGTLVGLGFLKAAGPIGVVIGPLATMGVAAVIHVVYGRPTPRSFDAAWWTIAAAMALSVAAVIALAAGIASIS
jgi:hypothetical protein